jgi:hypothetical protein
MSTRKTKESVRTILFIFNLNSSLSNILTEASAISKLQANGMRNDLPRIKTAMVREAATIMVVNLKRGEFVNDSVVI